MAAEGGTAWHALEAADVFARLSTTAGGLGAEEAEERLARHGPNRLPSPPRPGAIRRLVAQVRNPLVLVLVGAAAVSAAIGHPTDALVTLGVVVVNALIGFLQEGRAERALDAIRAMIAPSATVLRGGERLRVPAEAVVPGDIVLIEAGDRVPADLRLVEARGLRIDEAALTGESVPVDKGSEATASDVPLGDRTSMAFSGTIVAAGRGTGVAVATGAASEIGRISALVDSVGRMATPLVRQMDEFARRITAAVLAGSALVLAVAVLVRGEAPGDAFMIVVGIAVAAIPEGLPAVMTIALAVGVERMAARRAIVRRLPAVETLGSVSVVCSDKTGTLTRNEMTVTAVVLAGRRLAVEGLGYAPAGGFRMGGEAVDPGTDPDLCDLARAALLCNDADIRHVETGWHAAGDPMEAALVAFAAKAGQDPALVRGAYRRLDEVPFDARHRTMTTLNATPEGGRLVVVKGAPEVLIAACGAQAGPGGPVPLDGAGWQAAVQALAEDGQRVIAFASAEAPAGTRTLEEASPQGRLVLLGLVGLMDPPRAEVPAAVAECRAAGIAVKMITGDHAATALAIARHLKLADEPVVVVDGQALDRLDAAGLRRVAREATVFARTSPEHKLRLIEALQADGSVVAMTGDGVNDAPALRRADIAVAMGAKGTEAAKEASDIVLADDSFASIVAAVREGRTVYDNIVKVIAWTLPTDGGEALAIVAAVFLGLPLPVTPLQILWINMVTAVALGLVLAFEPTEPGAMRRGPRPAGTPLLDRRALARILFVSVLMVAGIFGVYGVAVWRGHDVATARTLVVDAVVAMEIAYLFSVRYVHGPSLTWRGAAGTPAVLLGIGLVAAAQGAFTYWPPLQQLFGTRPLGLWDGMAAIGVGVALFLVVEAEKRLTGGIARPR
ncbi:cation-translocating P-type ATPase [Prosthecomicrobium sp. N25]|uniref:cation-translocating P-type ATPase n=1 Tax=Prosthecomicrobium sp. N25 TaxID=3129254 RepID=UPI003076A047